MPRQHKHPSLQDLVNKAAEDRSMAGRALADLARKNGFEITHGTVNSIRSGAYKSRPSDGTIRAIAWLAGVGEETAFRAAGRTPPGRPFADDLPPGVDELEPRQRKAAVEMLRAMVAQHQEILQLRGDRGEDSPADDPGLRLVHDEPEDVEEPEGYELAARKGETRERKRRRLEGEPWDHPDPDGPEDGA
ncbi:hypothetical protein M1M07_24665 [Rhodococcus sp. HM1]|uniref:hypothetical protein n=1 Tax=Rhodococcus sp. HM1 TaxID=2937759 RepID=UPI00200AC010|nr:hypothetical protein [Rhodococcus sp. HM1]MCK8674293.1 hypothetical protein [Rhodococcus sp. HM1]